MWRNTLIIWLVASSGSTTISGLQQAAPAFIGCRRSTARGTGPASGVVSATTDGGTGTKAGAPTSLLAEPDGTMAITLSWAAPADTGSSLILGYVIEGNYSGNFNQYYYAYTTTTDYRDTDLDPGRQRHYRVSAHNRAGFGTPSNEATATTLTGGVADAPSNLVATADGDSIIELMWTAPTNTGGTDIEGYQIDESADGNSWDVVVGHTMATTTRWRFRLPRGTTRHYRVSTINAAGSSPPSDTASATTASDGRAGPPNRPHRRGR